MPYSELKRDREEWVLVYYTEPSHCNLCGNLNVTRNLGDGLETHSAPYLVSLQGTHGVLYSNLNVILVPFKFPHKLQCKVFGKINVPVPFPRSSV